MIKSPYNFVPLSRFVYFPDYAAQVSHDVPFSDGLSGKLSCTLTTVSPIYVRNGGLWTEEDMRNNPAAHSFFETGDYFIIPGSSIKGMLRNVIEIISFGKMSGRVDDHRYAKIVGNTDPDHSSSEPDLADTMFGFIGKNSLKGRVSVEPAKVGEKEVKELRKIKKVLATPHPTYYPNYLKQPNPQQTYKTSRDRDAEVRGWKRYPARSTNAIKASSDEKAPPKMAAEFTPLDAGAKFVFDIRFHNLRRIELGALIWALTWGGRTNLCHSLGMAKPFGFGQVKIAIKENECLFLNNRREKQNDETDKLMKDFIKHMRDIPYDGKIRFTHWEETEQVVQLLAMADPEYKLLPAGMAQQEKLQYMKLAEFKEAKNRHEILISHAGFNGVADSRLFIKRKTGNTLLEKTRKPSRLYEEAKKDATVK